MNKKLFLIYLSALWLYGCAGQKKANAPDRGIFTPTTTTQNTAPQYTNPVLPGDFADPSVTRVGDTYWASATSSEWAPIFPLLRSNDLVQWEMVGHVFPNKVPDWAEANFWAPEISYEKGKVYIYYTAKKKGGSLCVGVASATNPAGPYTDHGPLVCQDAGSIDGFPVRDENGNLYLVWKEDGNSRNLPTPIWAQRMNEERTALIGEKQELFRNDAAWEGNLVEGPSLIKRGDYFYIFYAGNACCGRECTYAEGVARSKTLLGKWEKYEKNPILVKNDTWKCPGHGTVITDKSGKYYFLYHAYSTNSTVYAGRQGLLDELTWTADGWPQFAGNSPGTGMTSRDMHQVQPAFNEEFESKELSPSWQWSVGIQPSFSVQGGKVMLKGHTDKMGAVLAQRTKAAHYTVETVIDPTTVKQGVRAGLAAIGDPDNALGISLENAKVLLWKRKDGKEEIIKEMTAVASQRLYLRLTATEGGQFKASWSIDGKGWETLNDKPIDGAFLPPWDRGVRTGLVVRGTAAAVGFDQFRLSY